MPIKPMKSGVNYFMDGFKLIKQPGLRTFVFIPLMVNLVLFSTVIYFAIGKLDEMFAWMNGQIPEYLTWLNFFLWPLAVVSLLVVMSFIFSSVMNWIAAPFNGLLAEKVEMHLTGKSLNSGTTVDLIKDLPRIMGREWTKLKYYLPRALLFLVLFIVPVVGQTAAPVLWFLFSAWMMAIQYCDFPFDNHKVPFEDMKFALNQTKGTSYTFGATVTLFSMIPIVNFIVMPVAICGATAMWVDKYRDAYKHPEIAPE
ncbi:MULTISPECIES: sulfate transporter CysZ [unclassified Shewanella]|uniref:sulfate transporter CysZ n=1 Tax=unclassified Shewanella TaxID=196818 RepID=UPI0009704BF1|nr:MULTISPECIES: sulfate transporter CysZ [unclassified Shewanella]MDO6619487.1 sulfate transporter CysZ [Shewanella sp. 6_MG-2023]MDO6639441.1 sulfate transporter CysZ [Shewanella sp. 5_MG-2023]MDO6678204.1 sulfate transporter CysZ [Shewanella sp. 4_MG-2023]MDO6775941.1 sulfate transporter CysZ [Shewanella sp. 3_MG-2023]PMG30276.1 sulfate transporter CysZ [Shewanella sp. 10N.286.52.C2]